MSDDPSFSVRTEWSAWPEDLDPVKAADQLNPMQTDDPHESLFRLLGTVPAVIGAAPTPIQIGSRMAVDRDAARGLINLPMMCSNHLAGSVNFLEGLYRIMRPLPKVLEVPRAATYPLIRGVIESSAQTVWLLGPSERRERLRRLLQLEKAGMDHDGRYFKVATAPHYGDTPKQRSDIAKILGNAARERGVRWKRLRDAGAVLGIDQSEFEHGVPGGWDSVISQAIAQGYQRDKGQDPGNDSHWHGRYSASIWFFIGGMSHPSMSRAWAGSLYEHGEVEEDGLMAVEWWANPVIICDALSLALRLHMRALRLWADASGGKFVASRSYWA
jgi:hypothetical protein